MDRASRAVRRSATKLTFPSGYNNANLSCSYHEFQALAKSVKSTSEVERSAAESLLKWSLKEENAAIKDVVFQTNELFAIWADRQREFSEGIDRMAKSLQKIQEASKASDTAKKAALQAAEKEAKLKKDIKKAKKWKKGGDVRLLEHRLQEVTRERQMAERHVEETKMEMEVVKMFRFREAMQEMSEAYKNMGEACTAIFETQQHVSEEVPAISTQDIRRMDYAGATPNRQRVEVIRTRFAPPPTAEPHNNRRRASAPAGRMVHPEYEPPPPYAPQDPSAPPMAPGVPLYPSLGTSSSASSIGMCTPQAKGVISGLLKYRTP